MGDEHLRKQIKAYAGANPFFIALP